MRSFHFRTGILLFVCFFLWQGSVWAAAGSANIKSVRFSSNSEHDRIVFDVDKLPAYTVKNNADGQGMVLEMSKTKDKSGSKPRMISDALDKVTFSSKGGSFFVTVAFKGKFNCEVHQLSNPPRVYIDINKKAATKPESSQPGSAVESQTQDSPMLGVVHTTYVRRNGDDKLTVHFLDIDRSCAIVRPALDSGLIAGRETLSAISDENNAVAAINASYFASDGEVLGATKIDGTIVSTTYIPRSAFGITADGTPFIGKAMYDGQVTIGRAPTLAVSGVNCERSENGLVIYNGYYDATTGTNDFGREFIVRDGKVTAINQSDSAIPENGLVISAHGTSRDALTGVHVGDKVTIKETMGQDMDKAVQLLGVGPLLLKNGQINVAVDEEQIPSDIASGRAPRTAVGIMKNGHILLAVADGRQPGLSIGCTLTEWAALLQKFGAVDAVNFDGGGSSEMVIGGRIVNSPSDGAERPIGCALIVVKK